MLRDLPARARWYILFVIALGAVTFVVLVPRASFTPIVPLLLENYSFHWAARVHGWVYDPWTAGPDLTAVLLEPPNP